ncbi:MAG: ubiquitin-like small modifier protein 1 [Candidatus Methanospirareceae archaeon]
MKVKVKLFASFRELLGKGEFDLELKDGSDVYELLNTLFSSPDSREKIFDSDNRLREYVIVVRNKKHINYYDGLFTKLEDGDEIAIFPPAGGG